MDRRVSAQARERVGEGHALLQWIRSGSSLGLAMGSESYANDWLILRASPRGTKRAAYSTGPAMTCQEST